MPLLEEVLRPANCSKPPHTWEQHGNNRCQECITTRELRTKLEENIDTASSALVFEKFEHAKWQWN